MTFQEKLFQLVQHLSDGTVRGSIKWSETADEDSFRAVLQNGLVRVERHRARPAEMPDATDFPPGVENTMTERTVYAIDGFEYVLVILDEKNSEIGRYTPDTSARALTLRNLWESANRSARNAEQKIDFLLREVERQVRGDRVTSDSSH